VRRTSEKALICDGRSASGRGNSCSNRPEAGCGANIFLIRGGPITSPIRGATV
jgi:hypothetical protein